jgi:hypothetical protein
MSTAQHPFGLQQDQEADQHFFLGADLALDQPAGSRELGLVVAHQKPHQDIGIETQHQRDRREIATGLRPFLRRSPARSMTLLGLQTSNTVELPPKLPPAASRSTRLKTQPDYGVPTRYVPMATILPFLRT